MQYSILVKTNKSVEKIIEISDTQLEVHVNTPPIEGRSNKRVVSLLAKHLKTAKSAIRITRGEKSRRKIVEIA